MDESSDDVQWKEWTVYARDTSKYFRKWAFIHEFTLS